MLLITSFFPCTERNNFFCDIFWKKAYIYQITTSNFDISYNSIPRIREILITKNMTIIPSFYNRTNATKRFIILIEFRFMECCIKMYYYIIIITILKLYFKKIRYNRNFHFLFLFDGIKSLLEFHFVLALHLAEIIIHIYYAHVRRTRACTCACTLSRKEGRDRKVDRNEIEREGKRDTVGSEFLENIIIIGNNTQFDPETRSHVSPRVCASRFAYDASRPIAQKFTILC